MVNNNNPRKIIHVDMDCFYAAVEIRDNPELAGKPVAVGGEQTQRGVLCTCNYEARQYGVRSAMSTAHALRLCPDLIVIPVNMPKYKEAAREIQQIFREYTDLVEPLSLDEAYLDVSNTPFFSGSATLIAKDIKNKIWQRLQLTASAGVASNKFLAKIASGWKKPDGLFVIPPQHIDEFIKNLPVTALFGVGKVTGEKLLQAGYKVCSDLHAASLPLLLSQFGKLGLQLYNQSRGIDLRDVQPDRIRKSLSVETTFLTNINSKAECMRAIEDLFQKLVKRLKEANLAYPVKNQFIKIKYSDFKQNTVVRASHQPDLEQYQKQLEQVLNQNFSPVRLLGVGVGFETAEAQQCVVQERLF
jgi:DNA polymerase IV